jgi:hypothetical protein
LAVKHLATGLSLAFNAGTEDHANICEEPGAVTNRCRGDDLFTYAKLGLEQDLIAWGPTSFYGEWFRGHQKLNESGEDALAALELTAGTAEELQDSHSTVWGVGVVQAIDRWHAEVYLGYRRYELEVDLIDGGGSVGARSIEDFDAVMTGATFYF